MNVKRAFKKNNIHNPLCIASNGLEALLLLRGGDRTPAVTPIAKKFTEAVVTLNKYSTIGDQAFIVLVPCY